MALSFLTQKKNLPATMTSYDVLKAVAVVLMVVDHIGHYFYPDQMWFRVIGRLSVPIWFFLIGYANTRQVRRGIWIGAVVLLVSSLISGEYLFPLNILFMLGIARLWVDGMMARALRGYEAFAGMFFVLLLTVFPSVFVVEYGSLGLMFAMFGYLRRAKADVSMRKIALYGFIAAISAVYILAQSLLLPSLSGVQLLVFVGGMIAVAVWLYRFEGREYSCAVKPLMILGRYTLEIYVIHLIVFQGIGMILDYDRFSLFGFEIMPYGMHQTLLALFM